MRDPADRVNPSYCYRCWYDNWLRRKYGVTVDEFEARLAAQGGVCAICGGRPADWKVRPGSGSAGWHADHDHESGIFRGVLCQHCNIGLGHFRDDLTLVRQAAAYLERHLTG